MVAPALTMEQLEDIQASCLADDIQIDFNRMSLWDEATARAFFESGGETVPPAAADAAAALSASAFDAAAATAVSEVVAAGAEPPSRVLRWKVDISTWDPTPAQWTLLLGLLTDEVRTPPPTPHTGRTRGACDRGVLTPRPQESTKTMRFKFRDDQKRALVSRCATPKPKPHPHPNPRPVSWGGGAHIGAP